jgi:hypothetical protein
MLESYGGEFQQAMRAFCRDEAAYLMRLVGDHEVAAVGMLADVMSSPRGVAESSLIRAHFGNAVQDGLDAVSDLAGAGLVARGEDRIALAAKSLKGVKAIRTYVRSGHVAIPVDAPQAHAEGAAMMYRLENRLRERVATWLGEVEETWWPSRIPASVVGEAESKMRAEASSRFAPESPVHPIVYTGLGELLDVIRHETNWSQVFRVRFHLDKDLFEEVVDDICRARNKIAHNRPFGRPDVALLAVAARRLQLILD